MTGNSSENPETKMNSFARLYDEHLAGVYRYISFRVGSKTVAEELTSTVFEKALTAFDRYRKEKAAQRTWLIAIARNTVTDYFRKLSVRNNMPLENAIGVVSTDPSPEEMVEKREEYERLRYCYSTLSQREQEIVSLKFGAEFTNRHIATTISLSESNVGIILFRAVAKLRTCIKDWLNGRG